MILLNNNSFVPDSLAKPSLFKNHLLEVVHDKPVIHFTKYDYGVAAVFFVTFIIFVWLYTTNHKLISRIFKSFYFGQIRFADQLLKEENSIINRGTVSLSITFFLLSTLFIGETVKYYGLISYGNYFVLLMKIAGGLIVLYMVKLFSTKILGFVFKNEREASDYISTIVLFWNALALFFIPLLACLMFMKNVSSHVFIMIGIVGISLFLLIRFGKVIVIGLNSPRISRFYLFLYLCAQEILPIVLLFKWSFNQLK